MEGKSPEFFRAYEVRLKIKEQIMAFNYLVSQQAQVTEKSKNMTLDSGSFSAPSSSMALTFPFAPFNPLSGIPRFLCTRLSCLSVVIDACRVVCVVCFVRPRGGWL